MGSPPRVREKLNHREAGEPCAGITPACAGKTNSSQFCHPIHWDHPRVCGKTLFSKRSCGGHVGSPPRMREKLRMCSILRLLLGITPAYAEKTSYKTHMNNAIKDHPRVCGKNLAPDCGVSSGPGSPPRMREKLIRRNTVAALFGITPAYAGKTHACIDAPQVS